MATANKSASKFPTVHILLCLIALLPVLIVPGMGVFGSLAIVLLVLAAVKASRRPTLAFVDGTVAQSLAKGVGAGLVIAAIGFAIDLLLKSLGWAVDLSEFESIRGNLAGYLALLAIGILIGGVVEELIFRGYVVGWGSALLGEKFAPALVLLSAAVFGFGHMYQGPGGMISTGLIGAMLGFVYLWANRKLLVTMTAHATINVAGITLLYLGYGF